MCLGFAVWICFAVGLGSLVLMGSSIWMGSEVSVLDFIEDMAPFVTTLIGVFLSDLTFPLNV